MNIGDKVKFLNETGGGVITKVLDLETVIVRIEEGFEVPVKIKGLIPDKGGMLDSIPVEKNKQKDETAIDNNTGSVNDPFGEVFEVIENRKETHDFLEDRSARATCQLDHPKKQKRAESDTGRHNLIFCQG